jgi:predicted metal-dependent hydrolase
MLPPLADDPRFAAGLAELDAGDYLEASDVFEELYFEAVRDEVPLVRFLLQVSTGLHHVSRGQRHAAVERLEEALRGAGEVGDGRGLDVGWMCEEVRRAIEAIRRRMPPTFRLRPI